MLHQEKTAKLWNHAFKEHSQKFPDCDGSLDWNQHGEEKKGLAWILSIRCKKCHYTSHREKLYEEVSRSGRGRRAAQLNVAMAVGHLGTSLTTEDMRGMLLGANIEPASATNIHQTVRPAPDMKAALQPFLQRPPLETKRDGLRNASVSCKVMMTVHSSFPISPVMEIVLLLPVHL